MTTMTNERSTRRPGRPCRYMKKVQIIFSFEHGGSMADITFRKLTTCSKEETQISRRRVVRTLSMRGLLSVDL